MQGEKKLNIISKNSTLTFYILWHFRGNTWVDNPLKASEFMQKNEYSAKWIKMRVRKVAVRFFLLLTFKIIELQFLYCFGCKLKYFKNLKKVLCWIKFYVAGGYFELWDQSWNGWVNEKNCASWGKKLRKIRKKLFKNQIFKSLRNLHIHFIPTGNVYKNTKLNLHW